jgi:hypothetical protein
MKIVKVIFALLSLVLSNYSLPQNIDTVSSQIIKLEDGKYKLGNLLIDNDLKEITIPGKVNMQKGLIEVFAASPGGKLHETIIVLDIIPYHLQVALLLLGLTPVDPNLFATEDDLGKHGQLKILVKCKVGEVEQLYRAEELVWDLTNNQVMQQTNWIFRGSKIIEGIFVADKIKSLITTYNDPTTIIDNPLVTGKNDEVYQVNSNIVPPKGSEVEVIIKVQ